MPVRMRKITSGKNKGKYVVVEPSGKRVSRGAGSKPTTRAKARARVFGQNLNTLRAEGRRGIPPAPRRRRRRR